MSRKEYSAILGIALLGGFLSNQWFRAESANAQEGLSYAKEVAAEAFILVDKTLNRRGQFTILPDGSPGLSLFDQNKPRVIISLLPNGTPRISLFDKEGKSGALLSVSENGSVFLEMSDAKESPRTKIGITDKGTPALAMFDREGRIRAAFSVGDDGSPGIALAGKGDMKPSVSLEVKGETPMLKLNDSGGKLRASLALSTVGNPALFYFSNDGKQEVTLGGSNDKTAPLLVLTNVENGMNGGGLILFGKDGKVLSKVP